MASSESNALNTNPLDIRIIETNELVTGPPAAEMLVRSGLYQTTQSETLNIMDNACGGGILTAKVHDLATHNTQGAITKRIVASDIEEKMISYVERRSQASGWKNVETMKIDQQSVPLADNTFTHVFNNFGIFFCPQDDVALSETFRITKSGGLAGFTSWKTIAWWPSMAMPAISAFIPDAPELPSPATIFPTRGWSDPEAIPAKLERAGFKDIQVSEYGFMPNVEAEPFAEACAVLIKVITKRFWTEEQNQHFGQRIEPALLRYLQENFPGGKWNGQMVAIISIGRKS